MHRAPFCLVNVRAFRLNRRVPTPPSVRTHAGLAPKEHQSTRIVALSFDHPSSPSVTLKGLERNTRGQPYGWGFAWYPLQSAAALVVKDATSIGDNAMTKLLREWERFRSTIFVSHLRGAARALAEQDTHPFSRSFGGREWVFAHNGDFDAVENDGGLTSALPLSPDAVIWPVGRTDSERAFCWLLQHCATLGAHSLAAVGWHRLHDWFRQLDGFGTANLVLTDGQDLAVYCDDEGYNRLHVARLLPPDVPELLASEDVDIGLGDAKDHSRTVTVFSTRPLANANFEPMADGQLIIVRRGAYIYDSHADDRAQRMMVPPLSTIPPPVLGPLSHQQPTGLQRSASSQDSGEPTWSTEPDASTSLPSSEPTTFPPPAETSAAPSEAAAEPSDPPPPALAPETTPDAEPDRASTPDQAKDGSASTGPNHYFAEAVGEGRLLSVEHVTTYTYDRPVERSTHLLRLQPVHDRWQDLVDYQLEVSTPCVRRPYDDVFGNQVVRVDIEQPFDQLQIRARSMVRVRSDVPDDLHSPHRRFSIPLVWMPWQRQMMTPYLLPPELPETQLQELINFAMSFVERQDYDLVQTLIDMNTTIYRDFKYVSGSTTMATTPFQVYVQRQGVCQDFANLLICLARLLSVPARYRVGYIYTGSDYENTMQSDASHAWAELYLPWSGWQGFDPTNGCLVNFDHVRVASGRNYGDATPTSGTIYKGGGDEKLTVEVRVEEV